MKKMNATYLTDGMDNFTVPFKITLGGLFPRGILSNMIKSLKNPNFNAKEKNNQLYLLLNILPDDYHTLKNRDIAKYSASSASKFFTYLDENGTIQARSLNDSIASKIISTAKRSEFSYNNFVLSRYIEEKLKEMLRQYDKLFFTDYEEDMNELIDCFEHHPILKDFQNILKEKEFYSKLTCLVLLSLTWSYWDNNNPDNQNAKDLSHIILPSPHSHINNDNEDWTEGYIRSKTEDAITDYEKCKSFFDNKQYDDCGNIALKIVDNNFASDLILGDANYRLALCYYEHGFTAALDCFDDIKRNEVALKQGEELMLKSYYKYGNKDAQNWLTLHDKGDNIVPLLCPVDKAKDVSRIILNATNAYSSEFLLSLTEEMRAQHVQQISGREQITASIDILKETRYLLLDESPKKNFQDFLYLLDGLTNKIDPDSNSKNQECKCYTNIYLRAPEDQYAALIDTAMKRLGDYSVEVCIIDDEKWASQYLLYHYPLFDTLKGISPSKLNYNSNHNSSPITINFTIVGNGNHNLTTRLIREVYWMGCFAYSNITLKINLIAPDSQILKNELHLDYSGMFAETLPDSEHISSISLLEKEYPVFSMSDPNVMNHVYSIEATHNSFNYYVINIGDDIQNMNYGIKLREWTIRSRIENKKNVSLDASLPIIAFYCSDSDIAHLSQNMVIQTIDQGNRWFNNYNIKPFGVLRDRYSWDAIDGGYLEKVAESTHLQYSGIKTDASNMDKIKALKEYFTRSYNRDSSMAVALSLPYRLFNISNHNDAQKTFIDNFIIHKNSETTMNNMAEQFQTYYDNCDDNTKTMLLYYEHSRWLRWAFSRGWKKASPEDVLAYMKAGNPKQQLFIARLHGCLCSLKELEALSQKMIEELDSNENGNAHVKETEWTRYAGNRELCSHHYKYTKKDFTEIDKSNIASTADILRTRWFDDRSYERTKEREI